MASIGLTDVPKSRLWNSSFLPEMYQNKCVRSFGLKIVNFVYEASPPAYLLLVLEGAIKGGRIFKGNAEDNSFYLFPFSCIFLKLCL